MRAIFKQAFARAGLPYLNPHSFRNTLVQRAYELKLDAGAFEAWSQNLGHEHSHRQAKIMRGLAKAEGAKSDCETAALGKIASILARAKKSA